MAVNEYLGLEDPTKQQGIIANANNFQADPNVFVGPAKPESTTQVPTVPKATSTTPTTPIGSNLNSSSWYTGLGKVGDQAGMQYWNDQIQKVGYEKAYSDFTYDANNNLNAGKPVGMGDIPSNPYMPNSSGIISAANSINSTAGPYNPTAPTVNTPAASTYTPATLAAAAKWNITPEQTVQYQLQGILDPNNPLMQKARSRGTAFANDRGLMNSTIGQTAADSAMYDVAVPIATTDAGSYAKAAGYNADMSNQFAIQQFNAQNRAGEFNAGSVNDMARAGLSAQTQLTGQQMSNDASYRNALLSSQTSRDLAQFDSNDRIRAAQIEAANRYNLANVDSSTRARLAEIDANYKNVLQSNQSATNMYQQITQNIAQIQTSNLSETAKQTAIANLETKLQESLSVLGAISGLNLADLVTVSQPAPTYQGEPAALGAPTNVNSYKYDQIWNQV